MKVLVAANAERDRDLVVTGKIIRKLRKLGIKVLNPSKDACSLYGHAVLSMINDCDIVIVVGGDGTILHASQFAYRAKKPILGVNVGTVGYMSSIEVSEIDLLDLLSSDDGYETEKRMMLNVKVKNEYNETLFDENALNEVTISHGVVSTMLGFEVLFKDKPMASYRADGIIFATPTGSTAYSLSAGGPIVDPGLDTIIATPICSHSFNSRSILFRADSRLSVNVNCEDICAGNAYITIDGLKNYHLGMHQKIYITKSKHSQGIIRLKPDSFYDVLSRKIK